MNIPALRFIKKNGVIYFKPIGNVKNIYIFGTNLCSTYKISSITYNESSLPHKYNFELLFDAHFCDSARIFLFGYRNVNFKLHHELYTVSAGLSLDFYATKITISKELVKKIEIPICKKVVTHYEILTIHCYPADENVMNEILD